MSAPSNGFDQKPESSSSSSRLSLLGTVPPTLLILFAILAIQLGAGIAKQLFSILSPEGTAAARIILSALLLTLITGKKIPALLKTFTSNWRLLSGFGLCIAAMNLFFYLAISRIPLGAAVTFEFLGPLTVAAVTSRKWSHFLWIALAAVGVLLLSPFSGAELNTIGIMFALLAGAGWACFIILAGRVSAKTDGNDGLAIGMTVAGFVLMPFAVAILPTLMTRPEILLACIAVSVLSTTIPFILEFEALKRMSKRSYGVLVSTEPAVATLVGAVLLQEHLGWQGMIAISCVVIAAIGITVSDQQTTE